MTSDGIQLSRSIREKAAEFRELCEGLDEKTASRAPEGRWSPKEIVSHLIGAEGGGLLPVFNLILERDTPEVDLNPGNAHFSGTRQRMTMSELLAEFDRGYDRMADFVSKLTPTQLERKAHVPALKESPLGEYPTLAAFIEGVMEHHMSFHVDHMREILRALGVAA